MRRIHARLRSVSIVLLPLLLAVPAPASAKSHLWKFTEIFSNADGSVQYIEMQVTEFAGVAEWETGGRRLSSDAQLYFIPANLPEENTFQTSMLLATPAFAALPGAPTPDFLIPAGFFDPAGDELRYRLTFDVFAFGPGAMPVDGVLALEREGLGTPVNSPRNFAGETGTIDASSGVAVYGVWPPLLVVGLLLASAARLSGSRWRRPDDA